MFVVALKWYCGIHYVSTVLHTFIFLNKILHLCAAVQVLVNLQAPTFKATNIMPWLTEVYVFQNIINSIVSSPSQSALSVDAW